MGGGRSPAPVQQRYIPPAPQKTPEQRREEARQQLGIDTYNIAFAGDCKNGKSSLINAWRRVEKDESDPNWAKTGSTETTMQTAQYTFPNKPILKPLENVILWDIPGGNTAAHPAKSYFEDKKLYAFDFVIIMTGQSLTENDMEYAKQVAIYKVPFAFVRSKCDQNLLSDYENDDGEITAADKEKFKAEGSFIHTALSSMNGMARFLEHKFCTGAVVKYVLQKSGHPVHRTQSSMDETA